MRNFKTVLIAGLMLCMVPQTSTPMKQSFESVNSAFKKGQELVREIAKIRASTRIPDTIESVHPDVEKALIKKLSKNSSLTEKELNQIRFGHLPNPPRLIDIQLGVRKNKIFSHTWHEVIILIPNLEEDFFKKEESWLMPRLIEIPDTELPLHLKERKALLFAFLKHEEGHYFHKDNTGLSCKIPIFACAAITTVALGLNPLWSLVAYKILTAQISKYQERRADSYAINHIDSPQSLRECSNFFKNTALNHSSLTSSAIKGLEMLFGSHPSHESRAHRFLQAAEKLEKQAKDRD